MGECRTVDPRQLEELAGEVRAVVERTEGKAAAAVERDMEWCRSAHEVDLEAEGAEGCVEEARRRRARLRSRLGLQPVEAVDEELDEDLLDTDVDSFDPRSGL